MRRNRDQTPVLPYKTPPSSQEEVLPRTRTTTTMTRSEKPVSDFPPPVLFEKITNTRGEHIDFYQKLMHVIHEENK